LEIHPSDIVFIIISIMIMFFLLRGILWKPLYKLLSARTAAIQESLDRAEKAGEEVESLKTEYQTKLDGLEEEGRALLRQSNMRADEQAKQILAEARSQADAVLEEARIKIESEKAIAVARARDEVAQMATDMAAQILKREISPKDTKTAAEEFFRESAQ
jgi:F-type H+-transporting ATPase subunit b